MLKSLCYGILLIVFWGIDPNETIQHSVASQPTGRKTDTSPSVIVQFSDSDFASDFLYALPNFVTNHKTLYAPYHIYTLYIDTMQKTESEVLKSLEAMEGILYVQTNKILEKRTVVPNDTFYGRQWNLRQIQMEEAWQYTTGGLNSRGDTLVIALIDDGFDINHPDFEGNIWVNRNEISGDSIDHDGNGYAGDFWGWNTYEENDEIFSSLDPGVHGMPIAGILGAKGNNQIGVAGMNWNIKILNVVGGGREDNAIASYGYVLTQKKRYIESGGTLGANVVATNASWGISYEFPESSPLWCAFYDSLGAYGIINMVAVTNRNEFVEERGDMPTLCPSPFIISVTQTDPNDLKTSGGYSKQFVHLGAPGRNIFSTESSLANTNLYSIGSLNSGTSLSTPHVAAMAPLIHAAACDSFLTLSQKFPDTAAMLLKKLILLGVDSIAPLLNITYSSGRLNAYKTLQLLERWCNGEIHIDPTPNDSTPIEPIDSQANPAPVFRNFVLYPNPGTTGFTLAGPMQTLYHVQVFSTLGELLFEQRLKGEREPFEFEKQLASGMYWVRGFSSNGEPLFTIRWVRM